MTTRLPLRVAIVGCGLIGRTRANALKPDELVACYDPDTERSVGLAQDFGGTSCASLIDVLRHEPDVVIASAIHSELAGIACSALDAGAHVLVEKPGGIGTSDIDRIASAASTAQRLVKVGFNHRFHPAIAEAVRRAKSGEFGEIFYLRAQYGHGGRLGYESEWRANPSLSGGGEIVDQGMHLIDLSHWLMGALPLYSALLRTQFWASAVDDNAVIVLGRARQSKGPFAVLHVSWTEWKNSFSLDIVCRTAKISVRGLGRSYGPEELVVYRMKPELGPPDVEAQTFSEGDTSWRDEWVHFSEAIASNDGAQLLGDLASARYAWSCIEQAQALNSVETTTP